jgi:hypothetical protein
MWFESPRSAGSMSWARTDYQQSPGFQNSLTTTINIGPPAVDRQVLIYIGGCANTATAVSFSSITSPGLTPGTWPIVNSAGSWNNSFAFFWNVIPTGTTISITITALGVPFMIFHVFTLTGCAAWHLNQIGAINSGGGGIETAQGATSPGLNTSVSNSVNAPFQWISNRFVPKGAVALGGGGIRGTPITMLTNQPNSWVPIGGSQHAYATSAYRQNVSGADENADSYGTSYSGTIAAHIAMASFGP